MLPNRSSVGELPLSSCFCNETEEAQDISRFGDPHVHCPCEKCSGKATWRMTAWRHCRRRSASEKDISNERDMVPEQKRTRFVNTHDSQANEDYSNASETGFFELEGLVFEAAPSCELNLAGAENPNDFGAPDGTDTDSGDGGDEHPHEASENSDPEDGFLNEEQDQDQGFQNFVQQAVLKLLEMKQKMGCSTQHFEELLEWGRMIHARENLEAAEGWPKTWNDVQCFLKDLGYSNPKHFWICLNDNHKSHYGLMTSKDEPCPHCGNSGSIPYYYLPLTDKVKMWCGSPEMCQKITAHWREQEHWLPEERKQGWGWQRKKEFWDGKSFAELSYFWNPDAVWVLPARCPYGNCTTIISAEEVLNSPLVNEMDTQRRVRCPDCGSVFDHNPEEVNGDPRNIAYDGKLVVVIQQKDWIKQRCTTFLPYIFGELSKDGMTWYAHNTLVTSNESFVMVYVEGSKLNYGTSVYIYVSEKIKIKLLFYVMVYLTIFALNGT